MSNGTNIALVFGGFAIIGGFLFLYTKGCDLGINFFCKGGTSPTTSPPTSEQLYPRERLSTVMEYIANQAVEDIDANTFMELGRDRKFEIKAMLFEHYKNWMEEIAEFNDTRLQPLEGRALAKYAQMILDVSRRAHIQLNPAAEAQFRANLFAGTPSVGNITSNRVLASF